MSSRTFSSLVPTMAASCFVDREQSLSSRCSSLSISIPPQKSPWEFYTIPAGEHYTPSKWGTQYPNGRFSALLSKKGAAEVNLSRTAMQQIVR
jgi:hypothetical protein